MITVFGTDQCPACTQVVQYLREHDQDHQYKIIGKDIQLHEVEQLVKRHVRSVPVIMFNRDEITFEILKDNIERKADLEWADDIQFDIVEL